MVLKERVTKFLCMVFIIIFICVCMLNTTSILDVIATIDVNTSHSAVLIKIEGYTSLIDVPTQEYVSRALKVAKERKVPLIIYLDTYGGHLEPTLDIVNILLKSDIPIIVYVKNKAYSAGTLIALASHILVMSRTAVIGATQPVTINPVTGEIVFVNESKVINPIVKTLEVCANVRNRNATLVKKFVYENIVLTGEEAVKFDIADKLAESIDEVLQVIQGVKLNISSSLWKLNINGYEELKPDIDIHVMIFLRNSIVNSVLLFIGIFGTLILITSGRLEFLPITILFLLLALVGGDISNRVVSLLLISLGALLLFVELFVTPGFGILGISGIIALILGILLTPLPITSYATNIITIWQALIIVTTSIGTLFLFVLYKAIKTLKKSKTLSYAPEEKTVGKAIDRLGPGVRGYVLINGELWTAESDEVIEAGDEIEVIERRGLIVKVRRKHR